jgi:hypothetical protein
VWPGFKLSRVDEIVPELLVGPALEIPVGVSIESVVEALRGPGLHHAHVRCLELLRLLYELVGEDVAVPTLLHISTSLDFPPTLTATELKIAPLRDHAAHQALARY